MNIRQIEGKLTGKGKRFAIVVSRFNSFVTERLLEGAVDCLLRHGTEEEDITAVRVPGAWEIPIAAKRLAENEEYDAVICLGAVIRGETPHFDYVAAEVSKGIASLSLSADKAIGFGILTTDSVEQAVDRAGTKAGNKGWDAALSALETAEILQQIG
ncbi:MAG: 6,7-dimethyl-8-ribityllumazine synthase [Spirochaetales bacterium]|nr:6,7-dimethyl-8-ribityllumazine synthase [Spirochaetales bacterium]MCF7938928.1 6,7-dimethyl-8-ribityllumazine synthase [Spirochaetales bacterium]